MAGITITLGGNFAFLNQLQAKVAETAAKIKNGFAERVGHRMLDGLLAAAERMPEIIEKAIDAASDYRETVSKVGVVFEEVADSMLAWSQVSATAFGQSRNEALAAAASYGNLFKAMGITEEQSGQMSKSLVELAADLASFNNTSVPDAIEAIGAALRGEAEPIRRYGVLLDDATLKAAAMAQGIYDGKGSLEPAARALAAYSVVLAQTTTAQGDFSRTSDGLANSQRIIKAQIDDATTAMGEGLVPTLERFAGVAKNLDGASIGEQLAHWASEAVGYFTQLVDLADQLANSGLAQYLTLGFSKDVADGWKSVFDVALQDSANKKSNAELEKFRPESVGNEVTSREDIDRKLVELEASKAMLTEMTNKAMQGARPEVQAALSSNLTATISALDAEGKQIRLITDEQIAANAAKRDAAAAEAAHTIAIEEGIKAYDKAKTSYDKALKDSDNRRRDALPIDEQIRDLGEAEKKLRQSFNVAIRTSMPHASGAEIVNNIERLRGLGDKDPSHSQSLKIATELIGLEDKRAALLREQAKIQDEANKKRAAAVADYDADLAMIRAQVEGDKTRVTQLEREASIRQRIADLVEAGVDPAEAARRAEAIVSAGEELKAAETRRKNEKATAEAQAIANGTADKKFDSNEDFLSALRDTRAKMDGATYQPGVTAVDSLQRIGGGGGFAGTDSTIAYQRTQTDLQREMVRLLSDMREFQARPLD